jgi:hypothetical protein
MSGSSYRHAVALQTKRNEGIMFCTIDNPVGDEASTPNIGIEHEWGILSLNTFTCGSAKSRAEAVFSNKQKSLRVILKPL